MLYCLAWIKSKILTITKSLSLYNLICVPFTVSVESLIAARQDYGGHDESYDDGATHSRTHADHNVLVHTLIGERQVTRIASAIYIRSNIQSNMCFNVSARHNAQVHHNANYDV